MRERGSVALAAHSQATAVLSMLSVAVTEYNSDDGLSFLLDKGVRDSLGTATEDYRRLFECVADGICRPENVGGNYVLLALAQLSDLLESENAVPAFVRWSTEPYLGELSTRFWVEYARGFRSLFDKDVYDARPVRVKGIERYWEPQLHLMEAISRGGNVDAAFVTCEDAFAKQQQDRSLDTDSYGIEGTGKEPVRWSFRLESLRRQRSEKK